MVDKLQLWYIHFAFPCVQIIDAFSGNNEAVERFNITKNNQFERFIEWLVEAFIDGSEDDDVGAIFNKQGIMMRYANAKDRWLHASAEEIQEEFQMRQNKILAVKQLLVAIRGARCLPPEQAEIAIQCLNEEVSNAVQLWNETVTKKLVVFYHQSHNLRLEAPLQTPKSPPQDSALEGQGDGPKCESDTTNCSDSCSKMMGPIDIRDPMNDEELHIQREYCNFDGISVDGALDNRTESIETYSTVSVNRGKGTASVEITAAPVETTPSREKFTTMETSAPLQNIAHLETAFSGEASLCRETSPSSPWPMVRRVYQMDGPIDASKKRPKADLICIPPLSNIYRVRDLLDNWVERRENPEFTDIEYLLWVCDKSMPPGLKSCDRRGMPASEAQVYASYFTALKMNALDEILGTLKSVHGQGIFPPNEELIVRFREVCEKWNTVVKQIQEKIDEEIQLFLTELPHLHYIFQNLKAPLKSSLPQKFLKLTADRHPAEPMRSCPPKGQKQVNTWSEGNINRYMPLQDDTGHQCHGCTGKGGELEVSQPQDAPVDTPRDVENKAKRPGHGFGLDEIIEVDEKPEVTTFGLNRSPEFGVEPCQVDLSLGPDLEVERPGATRLYTDNTLCIETDSSTGESMHIEADDVGIDDASNLASLG